MPIRVVPSPGQVSDKAVAPALLRGLVGGRDLVAAQGGRAHITTCRDRKRQRSVDPALYRPRKLVERPFKKLKDFRRIATRYEKTARNFLATILVASTRLWTRFESRT
jgi:transposase